MDMKTPWGAVARLKRPESIQPYPSQPPLPRPGIAHDKEKVPPSCHSIHFVFFVHDVHMVHQANKKAEASNEAPAFT
jgi:hypothetical protein